MVVDLETLQREKASRGCTCCPWMGAKTGSLDKFIGCRTHLPSPLSFPSLDGLRESTPSASSAELTESSVSLDDVFETSGLSPLPSPSLSRATADSSTPEPEPEPDVDAATFPFSCFDDRPNDFEFCPSPPPWTFTCVLKRYRPASDVDGPNTATISCKKRRIRQELITSRLSQPFSLPATHIINREAVAAGDKRFMKLAASADANKRCPSIQSSIIRRAALLNCTRSRVRNQVMERGEVLLTVAADQTTMLDRGQQAATGGRFYNMSPVPGPDARGGFTRPRMVLMRPAPHGPTALSTALQRPDIRPSQPGPSVLKIAEQEARKASKSPRMKPVRSPVLGPSDAGLEDVGEYDVAFPADESRYGSGDEEDSGDVYCDFSALFGGPPESDSSDDEEHSYEDCLDELDGISWVGR